MHSPAVHSGFVPCLIGGFRFFHEPGAPQRWHTGLLLFTGLTTRKQVEALPTGSCSSGCNADCSFAPVSERAPLTLLLLCSPEATGER